MHKATYPYPCCWMNEDAEVPLVRAPGVDSIEGYKVYGHCIPGCSSYAFDDSFWKVSYFLINCT